MATVSVIIPTYGEPTYLQKAIESVLAQSYVDYELIIVDDNNPGSTEREKTEAVISKFQDQRIRYIQHPYNKNGAAARNTGVEIAKGKYICFLDSDDEYYPDRLKRCVEIVSSTSSKIGGVYSGCEFRRGGKTYHKFTKVTSGNFIVDTLACSFKFCSGSNLFVKRQVIDDLAGFDEAFLRHQDYEFLVRLFMKYDLIGIPEILIIKNNENINVLSLDKQIAIKEQYLSKFSREIATLSPKSKSYIYHRNAVAIGENALRTRQYTIAWKYYKIAIRNGWLSINELMRFAAFVVLAIVKR